MKQLYYTILTITLLFVNQTNHAQSTATVGTGTATTNNPSPFRGSWSDSREQYIFTASELSTAGLPSGAVITALSFYVATKGSTQAYSGYTISIGHTSSSSFASDAFLSPTFTTCYSSSYSTTADSWNLITFSNNFTWNGTDNIIIQACYDNSSGTSGDFVRYNTVSYTVCRIAAVSGSGCSLTSPTRSDSRPHIRFTYNSCTAPTTQASSFSTSSVTQDGMTANWTRGNGNNVLVVARAGGAVNAHPISGTSYTANASFGSGSQIGTGNYVVYNGSATSVSVSGLNSSTTYHYAIYEYNSSDNCYHLTPLTGNQTTSACSAPSTQASSLNIQPISSTQISLEWTRGNGNSVLIVARSGGAVNADPSSGTSYTANASFGSGSQIGTGNYVVYNGTGTSVNITGLTAGTTYHFAAYEYYTSGNCYNANENVINATTYCAATATSDDATGITRIIFNTIDNASTGNPAYTDYTAQSTTVSQGSSYNLSVRVNTAGNFTVNAKAWIDWNRNGVFEAGEEYDLGNATNQTDGLTSLSPLSITVPMSSVTGNVTMRVRAGFSTAPTACGAHSWSEAEDYTITINSCSAPSAPSNPSVSDNLCGVKTLTKPAGEAGTVTYYWQGTNATGTSVANSSATYEATTSGTYYIRAYNSDGGCWSSTSGSVSVTINSHPDEPTQPTTTNNCAEEQTISFIGTPPASTSWFWQGTNSDGSNTSNSASTYIATSSNTYYLRARTDAGCWSSSSASITVATGITTPSGVGVINGNTLPCRNSTGNTYTVSGISNATSYEWAVPSGATITNGQGTNTIVVSFATTVGNITCTPINGSCNAETVILNIENFDNCGEQRGIAISGNWTNNGTFHHGDGTVVFAESANQTMQTNASNFYNLIVDKTANEIQALDNINIDNDLYINDGQLNTNNKTFSISQHLHNDGNINQTTSTFVFNSNKNSIIKGISTTSFYDLSIQKSSSDKILSINENINVSNNMLFTSGKIDLNGNNINLGSSGFITNETENNRIFDGFGNGQIIAMDINMNTNSTQYSNIRGLGISITTQASGNVPGNTTIIRKHTEIQGIDDADGNSILRSYIINPTLNTALNVNLEYSYFVAELNENAENSLQLFRKPGASQWELTVSTADISTNTIYSEGVNSFSEWTAAPKASTLPIELLDFYIVNNQNQIDIHWTTTTEINNDYFTIEKSKNAIDFQAVNIKTGAGNSNHTIHYQDIDTKPWNGTSYYRLKQTDFDGTYTYSKIISINRSQNESISEVLIYPNPCSDFINIQIRANLDSFTKVEITNIYGQVVSSENFQIKAVENTLRISTQELASGKYLLRIMTKSDNRVFTFIKK
jgi:hypothetical protein